MTINMTIPLIILGAIALAFYIPEKIRRYSVKAVLLKSIVSTLFIAVAVSAASEEPLARMVIMGLVCGLLGDIWLDLKYVFKEHKDTFTKAGFVAFGIGHILYVAGLIIQYGPGKILIASFILAAVAAAMVLALEKPMKLNYGKMRPMVAYYCFLLFATVFVSGGMLLTHGGPQLAVFFAGSVLFAASDLVLSGTYFGVGKERRIDLVLNYILYYGGQFMIAASQSLLG